jgi:hypothetical protein
LVTAKDVVDSNTTSSDKIRLQESLGHWYLLQATLESVDNRAVDAYDNAVECFIQALECDPSMISPDAKRIKKHLVRMGEATEDDFVDSE